MDEEDPLWSRLGLDLPNFLTSFTCSLLQTDLDDALCPCLSKPICDFIWCHSEFCSLLYVVLRLQLHILSRKESGIHFWAHLSQFCKVLWKCDTLVHGFQMGQLAQIQTSARAEYFLLDWPLLDFQLPVLSFSFHKLETNPWWLLIYLAHRDSMLLPNSLALHIFNGSPIESENLLGVRFELSETFPETLLLLWLNMIFFFVLQL